MLIFSHLFDELFQSDMSSSMENQNATGVAAEAEVADEDAVQPVVCAMINGRSYGEVILVFAIIAGLWKGLEVLDRIIKKIFQGVAMQEEQLRIRGNNSLLCR